MEASGNITATYVAIQNYLVRVDDVLTCCNGQCINEDINNASCIQGNGYGNVIAGRLIQYFPALENRPNSVIEFLANHSFSKIIGNNDYLLYYYEITLIKILHEDGTFQIGLRNNDFDVSFNNQGAYYSRKGKITLNNNNLTNGDIFGCGVIYSPENDISLNPYIFLTINGIYKGKIQLNNEDNYLFPTVDVSCCSLRINFGEEEFIYNVNSHIIN